MWLIFRRVDQVRYDCQHLKAALSNFQQKRYMKDQQRRDRELLLNTKFTTNVSKVHYCKRHTDVLSETKCL